MSNYISYNVILGVLQETNDDYMTGILQYNWRSSLEPYNCKEQAYLKLPMT